MRVPDFFRLNGGTLVEHASVQQHDASEERGIGRNHRVCPIGEFAQFLERDWRSFDQFNPQQSGKDKTERRYDPKRLLS